MNPRLPQPVAAVLEALRLDRSGPPPLPGSWPEALAYSDRSFVTLHWRRRLADSGAWTAVPGEMRCRFDRNREANAERLRRTETLVAEITERFSAAGLEFVLLKGLSHARSFSADPADRVQYDLDFFCPPDSLYRARDLLLGMGYEPVTALQDFPTDHLPVMIRRTGWNWRGDYFDPDHPPAIDLHFRFWDPETEQIAVPGLEQFWARRAGRELDPADQLGYAALHALRHVLRGSLQPSHLYEIAWLLERRREEASFWARWRELHPPELRRLEAIVFGLARTCFGCAVPEPPPEPARRWIERYGWSPLEVPFRPNKHELLLHLPLIADSGGSRWKVLRRRLVPLRLPRAEAWPLFPARLAHHLRVFLPTLWMLLRRREDRA